RKDTAQMRNVIQSVSEVIPYDSIVIAGKSDKIFFPEYLVMSDFSGTHEERAALQAVSDHRNIFVVTAIADPESSIVLDALTAGTLRHVTTIDNNIQIFQYYP